MTRNAPNSTQLDLTPILRRIPVQYFLVGVCLFWLLLLSSGLSSYRFALWFTVLLMLFNFGRSIQSLLFEKKLLILVNLVQLGFFVAINIQIFQAIGRDQFLLHLTKQKTPTLFNWIWYVGIYVVHLSDAIDILEEARIYLSPIRPHAWLPRIILLWLNVTVVLFLAALVKRFFSEIVDIWHSFTTFLNDAVGSYADHSSAGDVRIARFKLTVFLTVLFVFVIPPFVGTNADGTRRSILEIGLMSVSISVMLAIVIIFGSAIWNHHLERLWGDNPNYFLGFGILGLLLWVPCYLGVAISGSWSISNWLLFPLDNLVRILDLFDILSVYDLYLHSIQMTVTISIVAVLTRFVIACLLAEPIVRFIQARYSQVFMSTTALLESEDPALRLVGLRQLRTRRSKDPVAREELIDYLDDDEKEVRDLAVQLLQELSELAHPELIEALLDERSRVKLRSRKILSTSKLSDAIIPSLVKPYFQGDEKTQAFVLELLSQHRESAVKVLREAAKGQQDSTREQFEILAEKLAPTAILLPSPEASQPSAT